MPPKFMKSPTKVTLNQNVHTSSIAAQNSKYIASPLMTRRFCAVLSMRLQAMSATLSPAPQGVLWRKDLGNRQRRCMLVAVAAAAVVAVAVTGATAVVLVAGGTGAGGGCGCDCGGL